MVAVAGGAAAQPLERETLQRLGAARPKERVQATQALLRREDLGLAAVRDALRRAEAPEIRCRLLAVARHWFLRARAAEGFERRNQGAVGMHPVAVGGGKDARRAGILVADTFPGFPGHAHLRPGDVILALDGERLAYDNTLPDFQKRIKQRAPGDRVRFRLRRDGRPHTVAFRLGALSALNAFYQARKGLRQPHAGAWAERYEKLRALGKGPNNAE